MSLRRSLLVTSLVLLLPSLAFAADNHFLSGEFGSVSLDKAANLDGAMNRIMAENFQAAGDFRAVRTNTSEIGTHVRFQQVLNGMPVFGAQMIMHVDKASNIYLVNGDFGADKGSLTPQVDADTAMAMALGKAGIRSKSFGQVELGYVLVNGQAVLAWHATVDYRNAAGPQRDRVFASAVDGSLLAVHPQIHYAKSLATYDCKHGSPGTNSVAGCTLESSSSGNISVGGSIDAPEVAAHNYAGATYDYYNASYGRDSINNAGLTMKSRVHYSNNYNNAFWDGYMMTYGDGDGTTFIPLSQDADVVAHELTHGVTSYESNLTYSGESGALNESMSDIFGSEVDRATGQTGAGIWQVGEDIYTPGTPGDALREMAFPSSVGDYDCYPIRYTGSSDSGGVHWNSGISNLAFVLASDGGSHPASSGPCAGLGPVSGIGHTAAAKIWYEANANCATNSTNFAAMRTCTAAKALAFYGSGAEASVNAAWDAVLVTAGPPPGTDCTDTNIWTGTVPVGGGLYTPNCSASGTFNGVLQCKSGGAADLDLYLQKKRSGNRWNNVATSGSAACDEAISGYSGTNGTYRWWIDWYSGPAETIRLCTNKC